ncbi:MAG TPA: ABC transporter substrate-binding protein [Galbitalea sp.]|jgi:peptide/nickel transport system substrate-binding protein
MRVSRILLASLALASALTLTACAGSGAASSAASADGGTIVYAHQQEPACVFGGWIEQAYLSYQVLDNLVSLDAKHKVVPWLATSWKSSSDGLTWTFTLKKGVKFTDGTPVDAAAVAYNFDYWLKGGNSTADVWLAGYYKSAEAVNASTLRIDLSKPYPRLADNLTQAYFGIQSEHALKTRTKDQNCSAPIGSGAFIVKKWTRGQDIVLVRNDKYTSPPANALHTGPAHVKEVDWKFVADPTTRVAALQSGQVDALYDVPAVQWKALKADGFQLERYVTPGRPQQLSFNTQVGPFTDERLRQAFAYSLNRDQIVKTIGRGIIPTEGNGGVSRATPGYSTKAADWYSYNPTKANALLDAAGWTGRTSTGIRTKDGKPLTVILPYGAGSIIDSDGASILQGVKQQASKVGFDVDLIPVPQSELFAGKYGTAQDHDISVGYWTAVTAGILYINWRPSTADDPNYSNSAYYNDPKLEGYILAGNSAPTVAEQNADYEKAQDYIAQHALSIGVYDRLSTLAVSPKLKDVWQEHSQGGPTFYDAYFAK